jgi:hypothetical protein
MTENIPDQTGAAPPPPPIPPYVNAAAFTPSGLAITAFVLGILSFVTCGPCFGIPALVIGLIELQKIKNRTASAEGHAFALTGTILGTISTAFAILIIMFYIAMLLIVILVHVSQL